MNVAPAARRAALSLLICGAGLGPLVAQAGAAVPERPNIIVIQTDDQSLAETSRETMPRTYRLLGDGGSIFRNYIVTSPDCCPSRASLITGQYPHNHGVLSNRVGYPGLHDDGNVLPVWLQRAGYRTAHIGKFMNNYNEAVSPSSTPAPGWDRWVSYVGPDVEDSGDGYYRYRLSIDGEVSFYGVRPEDYVDRVLDRWAVQTVGDFAPRPAPFYVQLDLRAPHGGNDAQGSCDGAGVPDPRDHGLVHRLDAPRAASFDEAAIGDKPPWVRRLPRLRGRARRGVQHDYACAAASLRGVDRTVAHVYRAVERTGELGRTVFVFTSDNGFFDGEHRITAVKQQPYPEGFRVPMMMRVPGVDAPRMVRAPAANIDLAPTFLQLAQAIPCNQVGCREMDGRSLLPLLEGGEPYPAHRRLLVEFDLTGERTTHGICEFTSLWTPRTLFTLNTKAVLDQPTKQCVPVDVAEHYDLRRDPGALNNLAAGPTPRERERIRRLSAQLTRLQACAGSGLEPGEMVPARPLCR